MAVVARFHLNTMAVRITLALWRTLQPRGVRPRPPLALTRNGEFAFSNLFILLGLFRLARSGLNILIETLDDKRV